MPDSGSCNVLESMVSQERERPGVRRGGETDTEQSEAGHGRGGKKEGKETWRVIERGAGEGAVSKPAASQPIKSPEWEEGARETASAQAQSWLSAELRGVHRVRAGFLPGAEMSEVSWGRLVWREETRGRGRGREGEKNPLLGI